MMSPNSLLDVSPMSPSQDLQPPNLRLVLFEAAAFVELLTAAIRTGNPAQYPAVFFSLFTVLEDSFLVKVVIWDAFPSTLQ
jgi:hypothetical protein